MLNTIERRHEIVLLTEQHGKVSVKQLSEQFGVSTVTIRYDLNELNKRGLIVRSRGGAIASNRLTKELSIKEKQKDNYQVKKSIAKEVAGLINNGESIIIDSGTTTEEVASCLSSKEDLVVMTNGLNIANELARLPNCDVYMVGGQLRHKSMSFHDSHAEERIQNFNFNKVILGVDSIDISSGLSTHFEPEAKLNRVMCNSAEKVIVVTDSSKFGRSALHSILPLSDIDVLITDNGIPEEFIKILNELKVDLRIVEQG